MLPLTGAERSPRAFLRTYENRDWVELSPNGRWALYRAGPSSGRRILLRPVSPSSSEWPVGGSGVTEGHWRADGREIYYISGRAMMAQSVKENGSEIHLGPPVSLFRVPSPNWFGRNAFVVSPDGRRFLIRTGA
jgi:hypothetical protein